jgi:hypothetical protein
MLAGAAYAKKLPRLSSRTGSEEFFFDLVVNTGKPLLGVSSAIGVVPNLQLQPLDPVHGEFANPCTNAHKKSAQPWTPAEMLHRSGS